MADSMPTTRFRFWLWLIRLICVIVPRRLRAGWRQEWEAELRHREILLAEWDRLDWGAKLNLLRRSTSAFWDALWLQPKRLEDEMFQDLRYGVRMLLKNPGFTLIAALTLALGIGANTAIFSVVNAVLLRPLPYPESERLVWLSERHPNYPMMFISYPNFLDWQAQQTVFEQIGIYNQGNFNLTGGGEPLRLDGARMSAGAFAALRAQAAVGRVFNYDEDKPDAPPVTVISHRLWQSRFGGVAGILNQTIMLNGSPFTVIGVMPPNFGFPARVDVWLPTGPLTNEPAWQRRSSHPGLLGVARLKPGVTLPQAWAEMDNIAVRLAQQYPGPNGQSRIRVESLLANQVGDVRRALWTLLGAVGLVLLIACANVANLLLARAAVRQREMAVRLALGAGRGRIVRQLLTESLLLALLGGVGGVLLAQWGLRIILTAGRESLPRGNSIGLDAGALLFTAAVTVGASLLFGLAPAWLASRSALQEALKENARGTTGRRTWLRHTLVVGEIALTLMVVIGAGLLLRSFQRLQQVNAGFVSENVLSFRLSLPQRKYALEEQRINFSQGLLEKLRALPGVRDAGLASRIPLGSRGAWQSQVLIEDKLSAQPVGSDSAELTVASPTYFRTLGIPLLRGRAFTEQDNREHMRGRDLSRLSDEARWLAGLRTTIVDEEFARRHWPNDDPIGKRIRLYLGDGATPVVMVVGVVGRVRLDQLSERGELAQVYLPYLEAPVTGVRVALKTTPAPETLSAAARQQAHTLDPEQPVYDLQTLAEMRGDSIAAQRLNLTLLGVFAALALAVIGLYGVLAYAVTQRTQEFGIRMALGAGRGDVLRLVMGQGLQLTLLGLAVGLAGAFALTRVMSTLLYEVRPTDPATFVGVTLLLALVSLLACWIPARRATKVDPLIALRHE